MGSGYCDAMPLISQQACSSSQCKELIKVIQIRRGITSTRQLLLDMKIRWGSTYVMLTRAESMKNVSVIIVPFHHVLNNLGGE